MSNSSSAEKISSLLSSRQQDKEGLVSYPERFESEKNVVLGLFGNKLLDSHVENMLDYILLDVVADATIIERA